jgi:hypothetical protein
VRPGLPPLQYRQQPDREEVMRRIAVLVALVCAGPLVWAREARPHGSGGGVAPAAAFLTDDRSLGSATLGAEPPLP